MSTQRRRVLGGDGGITTITDNGVYIEGLNGKFYTVDKWQGGNDANSIVVASGDVRFRVAVTQPSSDMMISDNHYELLENYMIAISDETAAKADYNGSGNTANIMKLQSSASYAAGYCNSFIFPDGKTKGFLPSLGQLNLAYRNKVAVATALSKCGGTAMSIGYWSSTFYGVDSDSYHSCWWFNWGNGNVYYDYVDTNSCVRPFADLN